MSKRVLKKNTRFFSFLLAILLVVGDPSMLQVYATETVSDSDFVIEMESTLAEETVSDSDMVEEPEAEVNTTDAEFLPESTYEPEIPEVSGNITLREPEDFYEEPVPENYGTLASYDEFSRTYHVEGNQYVTVIGNDSTTYIDEEGALQQVDNTLVENPMATFSMWGGGTSYVNGANDYMAMLNGTVSEGGDLLTIASGDYMISIVPTEGSFQDGVVKENAIRYNNVFPGVDFQYTIMGNSVKEDIILLNPQDKTSFSYRLNPYGLKAELQNNVLYLYEEGTQPQADALFVFHAPEMEDAAGEVDFGVRLSAENITDEWGDQIILVTVTPDAEWLNAPERVYPVRVDPSAIQVNGSAIRLACAEEGSPNTAIGDNGYPYVGYDDGIVSKNIKYYGSKHRNTRTYFAIDYDFGALALEPEIVSAAFQVTQKTRWSKGTTEFGLFGVEEEWAVNSLTWNNQIAYTHYFVDSKQASTVSGEALTFDVTESVSAWVNGVKPNNGFVMKAMQEAPNEETGDLGVSMQCEVFHNSTSTYAPKLIISWTGELSDLSSMTLDDTTIQIYPVVQRSGDKSSTTLGVVAHGLAKPGSTVTYQLVNGSTGTMVAQEELIYPDSSLYAGSFPGALPYNRRLSNWQSGVFSNLTPGQVYYITATASEDGVSGKTVTSDTFLIYEEGAFDLMPRIANHYGVELDTILSDMQMQDSLTKSGNWIFIRNPKNISAYSAGELSAYYQATIDGLLLGRAEDCEFGFEPININTGNFYMEQEDASLSDIGGAFSINRQYNSKGAGYKGSLGYGWTFAYDERLGELADGTILWAQNTGGIMTFTRTNGGYQAPAGQDYELVVTENGYVITNRADGSQHVFDNYGLLTEVKDVYGNTTTLVYDMEYHLKSILTPSGKEFKVSLDAQERITGITLPNGYGVNYAYDEAGNLVGVTNPAGNTLRFEYNDAHYMTAWYDENGHRVVANVYDSEGRVIKQTDAEDGVVTLTYESTEQGGRTISTDAEGNVTTHTYDNQYRTTGIAYPDSTNETRSYNEAGYLASVTDRMGVTTTYTYDGKGNLLSEKRQDGAVRSYTYNDKNQVTSVTEYDGGVTTYTYNEKGLLTKVTDSEKNSVSYTYDAQNRLVTETDAKGTTTKYTYDGANIISMTDGAGKVWKYTYDAMNRMLTTTDPKGQVWKNTYDAQGRCIAETDPAGGVTLYTFDKAGAVTAITDKEGHTSTFTYDKMNRILSGLDPLGNTLTYTYDKNGNKLTETDAEGATITYEYDSMNRISAVTDAAGKKESYTYNGMDKQVSLTDRMGNTATVTYDAVKQVVTSETDKEGNVTSYETDICGRITKITYADGSSVSYTWDKLSRMTSATDQLGMVTKYAYDGNGNVVSIQEGDKKAYTYTYDALNRVVKTVDPLGNQVSYTYDALGNMVSATDAKGNTTSYTYDALNRLTALKDAMGGVTSYAYDKESRVVSVTAPEGDTLLSSYDAIGQLTAQKDAAGYVTTYEYDGVSRPVAVTDALKGVTSYTYDKNYNLLSQTDPLGNAHTYTVDAEGRLLTDTYPNGEKESYTYDKNGNVATYTDRYGVVTTFTTDAMGRILKAKDTAGNEMTYTYDPAGNLLTQKDVLGRTASYIYDVYGRPVAVTGMDGVTTKYEYDDLDRLVKVIDGEGKVTTYEYDAASNLIHTTEPGEAEYTYTYDALNRLAKKVDPVGAATEFVYDKNSNLTQTTDGNDVTVGYTYDALNRLTTYTDGNGGKTGYTYDALSRLTAITTPEGLSEKYSYDAVGNLVTVTDGMGQKTTYAYDKLYRMVQTTSPMGAVEKYTYDRHDVVTSVTDALGGVTTYKVNANGQVAEKIQANGGKYTYTYDAVQRMTSITTPLGYKTNFTYNAGNDVLTQKDSLGRTTSFTYDVMHHLQMITDAEGGVTTYEYDVRGNQSKVTNALGYSYSYTYDKVDRMTTVVDPEEKVTVVVYDMVGNVTSITTPGERTTTYGYDKNYNNVSITDPMGYVYGYSFDQDDRLSGTTDPLKQTITYTYDGANRLTALKDKMGLTESFVYDAHGNVVKYTATDGLVTDYTYDLKNRLTSVTDPMGSTAYYTYDVMDNLTAVTDYMGRGTSYTYDIEGNMLSITDAAGRKETMTYDVAGRITSYTSNGGNRITYDYDKLDNLVEKSYQDAKGKENAEPVKYAYDALGQRINMYDSTGETAYTYDGLGRITSVTTYRNETGEGDVIGYTYDTADNLSAIIYPDGTKVSYEYDKNDNLTQVTDRDGQVTTYVYDALNRITEIHRPNGVSTYNTYNARDQIVELTNICDDCEWVVSRYSYTYDERGFIVAETAIESLAGYAYDDKHNGKHADGKHDDLYPHGTKHNKHDKDATFAYQIVQTDRTFTYDDAGKLLSATETEDNYGTYVYTYEYDLMGNRTAVYKKDSKGKVVESEEYSYNKSNQVEKVALYDGKKNTTITYSYDKDGNRISEIGKIGTDKVEKYYEYTVENRLAAVYDKDELLIALAYDGDGNRVFQLNYNLHTDEDWKGNSGNGNGNNKDNKGSGNNGKGNSNNGKGNSKSTGTDDAGYGNATNAEEHNSQNQSGILFPIDEEVSETEQSLINQIKTTGKEKNYELIEYLNDVNREYVEVLVEQNINGKTDTSYVYGVNRLSLDRFDGSTGYYLYDPRGSVVGITNEEGQIYQSYRYSATGELTFGAPQYENEYTYNGESYNPNIESQYLRARYYNVVTATFLTEDSYLGNINEPLTLNRYNYCASSYLNYKDPSGNYTKEQGQAAHNALQEKFKDLYRESQYTAYKNYYISSGYIYSATGAGYADMVLELPDGALEVYEIKSGNNYIAKKGNDLLKQNDMEIKPLKYLLGYDQRIGYEEALGEQGITVVEAKTFNPNGWVLPIKDAVYDYAYYFTVPDQPGMIYYWLKKNNSKPKKLPQTVKVSEKKSNVRECVNKVTEYGKITLDITIAVEAARMMINDFGIFLDKKLSGWFPIVIPKEMFYPVYPRGSENYEAPVS